MCTYPQIKKHIRAFDILAVGHWLGGEKQSENGSPDMGQHCDISS